MNSACTHYFFCKLKLILFSVFILFCSCIAVWEKLNTISLSEIKKRGKLKVITSYNPNSYFLYKDQPIGYEYELLKLLAKDLGVELDMHVTSDLNNIDYMLNNGEGDLIAANSLVTREKSKQLKYTEYVMTTKQVLIQRRKNYNPKKKKVDYLENAVELIGKTIHVRENSDFHFKLKKLQDEIGGSIKIAPIKENITIDELIEKVYSGEIDYTVADDQTALINQSYYSEIDSKLAISIDTKIAWVVRRNSSELLEYINDWILKNRDKIEEIQDKYYRKSRLYMEELKSEFKPKSKSSISAFDTIIKIEAEKLNWDWRLLASLIFQESRFNPSAQSWAGARGLMQIMPETAAGLGLPLSEINNPKRNIETGVKHLQYLQRLWKDIIPDEEERIKFVLASYNAGQGHVLDAMTLTKYFNKKSTVWDKNVEDSMLLLSDPAYFNGYGVKYGYCRGIEPYKYVHEIFDRYKEFRDKVKK
jgi:membrane-bound lytic murein transglycosylase F